MICPLLSMPGVHVPCLGKGCMLFVPSAVQQVYDDAKKGWVPEHVAAGDHGWCGYAVPGHTVTTTSWGPHATKGPHVTKAVQAPVAQEPTDNGAAVEATPDAPTADAPTADARVWLDVILPWQSCLLDGASTASIPETLKSLRATVGTAGIGGKHGLSDSVRDPALELDSSGLDTNSRIVWRCDIGGATSLVQAMADNIFIEGVKPVIWLRLTASRQPRLALSLAEIDCRDSTLADPDDACTGLLDRSLRWLQCVGRIGERVHCDATAYDDALALGLTVLASAPTPAPLQS